MLHDIFQEKEMLCNNKGTAFFGLVIAMLLFTTMGIATIAVTADDAGSFSGNLNGAKSFYVADAGVQYVTMTNLYDDTNFLDNSSPTDPPFGANSITLGDGEFWVEYLNKTLDTVEIRVTARVGNSVSVVQQKAVSNYPYAFIAGNHVKMNNSAGNIYGNLASTSFFEMDPDVIVTGSIRSDSNFVIPQMSYDPYALITFLENIHFGDITISSDYEGNLYVFGDVYISGGVTITGVIYATDDIEIMGNNITINGTLVAQDHVEGNLHENLLFNAQPLGPNTPMPAIIADHVHLDSTQNISINGIVWGNAHIALSNTANVTAVGAFISNDHVHVDNAANINLTVNDDLLKGVPGLTGMGGILSESMTVTSWQANR